MQSNYSGDSIHTEKLKGIKYMCDLSITNTILGSVKNDLLSFKKSFFLHVYL